MADPRPPQPSAVTNINDLQSAVTVAGPNPNREPLAAPSGSSQYPNLAAFHLPDDLVNLPILFGYGTPDTSYTKPGTGALPLGEAPGHTINVPGSDPEMVHLIDAMQQFASMSGDGLAMLQAALVNRGFIKQRGWGNFGDPDTTSLNGWQKALEQAARGNKTIWEVLTGGKVKTADEFWKGGKSQYENAVNKINASLRPNRAPLQIRYSNPEDLKNAARGAALDTLGYVPDDDYLNDFVKMYHGLEGGTQKKAYAGGNFTEAGSAQGQAAKVAREEYKTEASSYGTVQAFDAFLNIIGAHGSEVAGGQ